MFNHITHARDQQVLLERKEKCIQQSAPIYLPLFLLLRNPLKRPRLLLHPSIHHLVFTLDTSRSALTLVEATSNNELGLRLLVETLLRLTDTSGLGQVN